MYRRFGGSFGSAENRPFLLQFGSAEAVAESTESTTKCFVELKICENVIAVVELTYVAMFATLSAIRNTLYTIALHEKHLSG